MNTLDEIEQLRIQLIREIEGLRRDKRQLYSAENRRVVGAAVAGVGLLLLLLLTHSLGLLGLSLMLVGGIQWIVFYGRQLVLKKRIHQREDTILYLETRLDSEEKQERQQEFTDYVRSFD